jgi:hypothetical protein
MPCSGTRRIALTLGLFFALGVMSCFPSTVRHGFPPQIGKLNTLTPGASTTADIVLALGQPRGDGVARFTIEPTPRQIYYYEYVEAGTYSGKVELSMLVVFVRDGRYDGHLWFSSANQLQ